MNKIHPIGYSAPGAKKRIDDLLQNEKTLLIDTRIRPYSWNEEWREGKLQDRYGERYKWAGKYLGNKALGTGGIEIADPDTGIMGLMMYLGQGYDLILLCQCAVLNDCHVSCIVDLLLQKMTVEVVKFGQEEAGMVKCLSIRQPWAWLVASGLKDIENRDWETDYRGPILIHASKAVDEDCFIGDEIYFDIFEQFGSTVVDALPRYKRDYTLGCIVGQANLIGVVEESESQWFCGTYGFVLKNARTVGPIPYRGALRLFDVPRGILEQPEQETKQEMNINHWEGVTICRRSGTGKSDKRTWAVGDKCFLNDASAIITKTKMEGATQLVKIKMAVNAPLLGRKLVSDHQKWIEASSLKPRGTIIPEFGERDEL